MSLSHHRTAYAVIVYLDECVSPRYFSCAYCGRQLTRHTLTIDHIMPRSLGGPFWLENTCIACNQCNFHKGTKHPDRFVEPTETLRDIMDCFGLVLSQVYEGIGLDNRGRANRCQKTA